MGNDRVGGEHWDPYTEYGEPGAEGWPSGCYKNMHNNNVHFNSIPTTSYQQISSWQKKDQRKICKVIEARRLLQVILV